MHAGEFPSKQDSVTWFTEEIKWDEGVKETKAEAKWEGL